MPAFETPRPVRLAMGPPTPDVAAPDADVLEAPADETRIDAPWRVVVYNDDIHTFEEVILQLVKATGCTEARAERHAWTIHLEGKDRVYEGEMFDCLRVQGVLREIALVTEIEG